ncbi:Cyclin-C [Phytophthora nicotianae]|uniref:Cyclin-C n=1 Tax=Phytophthora nicotianae TaxID=4792 RepID=A0A0W8C7K1_PHYNI|nr:Cyclin-C [Phytophthora nicotianae]
MGMNFWHSTHYLYWMKDVTKADLRKRNPQDRRHLADDEIDSIHLANISRWKTMLMIWWFLVFAEVLEEIGPRLRVRQIIIYTAIIFYRRFYQTQSFVNFDPHLVVGTVFFLASKVEESQLSLTTVASVLHHYTTTGVDEDESMYTFQDKDILECEFYVIEALQFDLILHHPFPSLLQYGYINLYCISRLLRTNNLSLDCRFLDEFEIHEECLQLAWQLVQYSYRTDIILLYPPFMVAYAAAYISCRDAGYDAAQVFASVNIKKDLLLKIVGEFQEAVEDEKRLYAVQATALEKLEEIIPDASAAEAEAAPSAPAEK